MIIAINKNKKDKKARAILSRMMFRMERDVFVWYSNSLFDDIQDYLNKNLFEERSILFIFPPSKEAIHPKIIILGNEPPRGQQNQIGLKINLNKKE